MPTCTGSALLMAGIHESGNPAAFSPQSQQGLRPAFSPSCWQKHGQGAGPAGAGGTQLVTTARGRCARKDEMKDTSVHPKKEYEFEKQFNEHEAIQWMQENWKKSFLFSALYAAFIFGGRHLMNKRAKFELRKPLVLWSLSLAVFSIFGAVRTAPYMLYILMTKGLKQSVCDQSFYIGPVSKFWAYAFVLSKAPELGDTIFIILRKQKLIFLHWYHHITVLLYSWYSYKDMVAGGGWFMTMNYGVHAVMYSYYALRAAGFRVSRKFAMFITLSQITQMLVGCVINYLVFSWMQHGQCHSHVQNIIWSSLMYLSYFVLFCHFFFEAYIGKTTKARKVD
ncbi:elongation of very long chain fatty acids protein 6 isoform X1 [Gallus gallus]|nr:elongation of very long chain fatty acids protein 6 isoform X1 [Gallus gallus]XP_046796270.1 elongation of very long chain fatty acids protein 6 isoform X1 [Gallus gallus]